MGKRGDTADERPLSERIADSVRTAGDLVAASSMCELAAEVHRVLASATGYTRHTDALLRRVEDHHRWNADLAEVVEAGADVHDSFSDLDKKVAALADALVAWRSTKLAAACAERSAARRLGAANTDPEAGP